MAKAKKNRTTAPPEWVREFVAKGGNLSTLATLFDHEELRSLAALTEHFDRKAKDREVFNRTAESILGSIERHRAKVAAPLPRTRTARVTGDFHTARDLVEALAEHMKATGEIRDGDNKTVLAKKLGKAMRRACAKPGSIRPRPLKDESVKNKLADWGLWPISSIK